MAKRSFFELYAHEYDALTNAAARAEGHRKEVAAIIERFGPSRVLDAGCATGLTSSLFAEAGVTAVGLDRSRAMLEVAQAKFAKSGAPVSFRYGRFEALPASMNGTFDLVVCLANSISGVGSVRNLRASLAGFGRVLRPGGTLVLQLLNVEAVREGEIMPVRATQQDGILYLRFMERLGMKSILHIVRVDQKHTPPIFEPFRNESEQFSRLQIEGALKRTGFAELRAFGDLSFGKRFGRKSRDLVLTAKRPARHR
jgi:ubiquinone/menaquinone biosynthesis C-methylase UbiE